MPGSLPGALLLLHVASNDLSPKGEAGCGNGFFVSDMRGNFIPGNHAFTRAVRTGRYRNGNPAGLIFLQVCTRSPGGMVLISGEFRVAIPARGAPAKAGLPFIEESGIIDIPHPV
jgi:hypothetical protein